MLIQCGEHNRDKIRARFCSLLGLDNNYCAPRWPLPNMKEVDERDFWGWRSSYSFKAEAWVGQIKTAERDPTSQSGHPEWGTLLLYLVDHSTMEGGGFAVVYNYNARPWGADTDQAGAKSVRYFKWVVCRHEWTAQNIGRCLSRHTCKLCAAAYDVDSSD